MTDIAIRILESVEGPPTISELLGNYSMKDQLFLPFDSPDKEDWSYWPRERAGLALALMNEPQLVLTQELLWSLVSPEGYFKLLNIMHLENFLVHYTNDGFPRSMNDYILVFFGEPSASEPWSWRFEGHHISLNVTVSEGAVAVTPSFVGVKPSPVPAGPLTGLRILRTEEDNARALIHSMSPEQREQARLAGDPQYNAYAESIGVSTFDDAPHDPYGGHFLKPRDRWQDWREQTLPAGLKATDLTEDQRPYLQAIVDEVTGIYREDIVAPYNIDIDDLYFGYIGSFEPGGLIYFRLSGSDFVYEFDYTQAEDDHIHTIWRSRSNDLGSDLLKHHHDHFHNGPADTHTHQPNANAIE
ncbi:MAG: DUF3500 domain-containing protein [Pseudomonadota bacterium]